GEVYLLVEVVLRDMDFSVLLNELRIGQMNPQQRQQRIREIAGTKHINKNDIYKIQPDVWLVRSITNDEIEYSVHAKRILDEQKINTEIQECTSEINDLRFECENLEKENDKLSKERELYESQAVKAVSKMNNRSLQETYRSSIILYCKLLDIELPDPKDQFMD
ncbi:4822_t:CDS:2, partial [Racocetra fulgida]